MEHARRSPCSACTGRHACASCCGSANYAVSTRRRVSACPGRCGDGCGSCSDANAAENSHRQQPAAAAAGPAQVAHNAAAAAGSREFGTYAGTCAGTCAGSANTGRDACQLAADDAAATEGTRKACQQSAADPGPTGDRASSVDASDACVQAGASDNSAHAQHGEP